MAESGQSEDLSTSLKNLLKLIDMVQINPVNQRISGRTDNARKLADLMNVQSLGEEISDTIDQDTENERRTSCRLIQSLMVASMLQQKSMALDMKRLMREKRTPFLQSSHFDDEEDLDEQQGVVPNQDNLEGNRPGLLNLIETDIEAPTERMGDIAGADLLQLEPLSVEFLEEMLANLGLTLSTIGEYSLNGFDPMAAIHVEGPSLGPIVEGVIQEDPNPAALRLRRRRRRRQQFCVRWGRSLAFLDKARGEVIAVLPRVFDDSTIEIVQSVSAHASSRGHAIAHARAMARGHEKIVNVKRKGVSQRVIAQNPKIAPPYNVQEKLILQRKRFIRLQKPLHPANHAYTLPELTPPPLSRLELVYTFIALLELHDEGMVELHTDEKLFFTNATFK